MDKTAFFLTSVLVLVFGALSAVIYILISRNRRLGADVRAALYDAQRHRQGAHVMQVEAGGERDRARQLEAQLIEAQETLKKRPVYRRATYKIATVGARGCGKTNLTFRCWANPIFRGKLEQTQFARYNKTVSRQVSHAVVDHVFEILDWGGELVNEAQASLVKQDINAMLMVVDLGFPDHQEFSEERVRLQLEQFNCHVMFFFFSPEIIKHCQTFVLFINKTDLLSGFPAEIEEKARRAYQPLIDIMMEYGERHGVSINVFVGSAETGAGTGRLFAHLIERILRPEDYDEELLATLDNIKQDGRTLPAPKVMPPPKAPAPSPSGQGQGRNPPLSL